MARRARSRFTPSPNQWFKRAVPRPLKGAYHGRHETLARDAMDAGGIEGERYRCGRQSRVVLAPDAGVKFAGITPQATVANKPDHRGERGISRKPLRRGCPGASAEPVCSCAPLLPLRMRPRVQRAPGIPCALWFMEGQADGKNSGELRRGNANSHLTTGVIPGREAKRREPGIHPTAIIAAQWIPGSRCARPGMTTEKATGAPRNDEGGREACAKGRVRE